jgi:hypothetical protein
MNMRSRKREERDEHEEQEEGGEGAASLGLRPSVMKPMQLLLKQGTSKNLCGDSVVQFLIKKGTE